MIRLQIDATSKAEAPRGERGEAALVRPKADAESRSGLVHLDPRATPVPRHRHGRQEGRDAGGSGPTKVSRSYAEKLVIHRGIRAGLVEQYRKLATVLHHAQTARAIKVVMIASAVPAEGKTLTVANLALTLSESFRRKVLLVDADLRRPSIHTIFEVTSALGLSDVLSDPVERPVPVFPVSAQLSIVPAGRPDPDPISGLTSDRMRRFLAEAAGEYEWVLVDTPPVGLLPDASLLGAAIEAALLVIRAGSTPFGLIHRAVDAIGRDRIIGVVLNRVEERAASGYGYTYSKYYGYYDSYLGRKKR